MATYPVLRSPVVPSLSNISTTKFASASSFLLMLIGFSCKSCYRPVERMVDGKFKSTLTVSGCGTFVGIGRNFRIAKSTAAQRALTALQKRQSLKTDKKT